MNMLSSQKQSEDVDKIFENYQRKMSQVNTEINKLVFGQETVIEQIIISLLCGGHALIIGLPGLAKTRIVNFMGLILGLETKRVQFTPDLMPGDILGTEILDDMKEENNYFKFIKGPIFSQLLLADEINRASPRTQSALLQAMQEKNVTVGNETYELKKPFFVFATQNPIEQEGTYPLPEAQLDRFMFNLIIDYPTIDEETEIVKKMNDIMTTDIKSIINIDMLLKFQNIVVNMPVADNVVDFAVKLVRSTRIDKDTDASIKKWLNWGAGPRASAVLVLAAKANALIEGRTTPEIEDIKYIAKPVLRHRIIPNFNAEAEGLKSDDILDYLLKK